MIRKVKCIMTTSVLILGSFLLNQNISHATLKSRFIAWYNQMFKDTLKNLDQNSIESIIVPQNVQEQVIKMYIDNYTSGADLDDFDLNSLKRVNNDNFYHQYKTKEGKLITVVSKTKPEIVSVDGFMVTVKFKNEKDKEMTMVTDGVPFWFKGSIIIDMDQSKEFNYEEPIDVIKLSNKSFHVGYKTPLALKAPLKSKIIVEEKSEIEASALANNLSNRLKNNKNSLLDEFNKNSKN